MRHTASVYDAMALAKNLKRARALSAPKPLKRLTRRTLAGWLSPIGEFYVCKTACGLLGRHETLGARLAAHFRLGGDADSNGTLTLEKLGWVRVDLFDEGCRSLHFCGKSCITVAQKRILEKLRAKLPRASEGQVEITTFLKGSRVRTSDADCTPALGHFGLTEDGMLRWFYE